MNGPLYALFENHMEMFIVLRFEFGFKKTSRAIVCDVHKQYWLVHKTLTHTSHFKDISRAKPLKNYNPLMMMYIYGNY